MRGGHLRHRVEILTKDAATSADSYGAVDAQTTVIATVQAKVTQLSGLELIRAHQVAAEVTHEVRIRYRPGMTTRHSIKYAGKTYDINNVNDIDGRHRELILLCKGVG